MAGTCSFVKGNGERCRAAALHGSDLCYWHEPSVARERAEARRLGGLRRRREKATSEIYAWAGLGNVPDVRRLIEVAVVDTLGLDNSPARSRALAQLANLSLRALEVGELAERLAALEKILHHQGGRG